MDQKQNNILPTHHIKKENDLPINKTLLYLSQKDKERHGIKLSREAKCFLYDKLINGDLVYGNIPPEYVIPYLIITPEIKKNIINTTDIKGNHNLIFLDKAIEDNYIKQPAISKMILDFFKYNQFGSNYNEERKEKNLTLTVSSCDDFPIIDLNLFTDNINYKSNSYGIINSYSFLNIRELYNLTNQKYSEFYDNISSSYAIRLFLSHNILKEEFSEVVKYNTSKNRTRSLLDVVNLYEIAENQSINIGIGYIDSFFKNKKDIMSVGGRYKILKEAKPFLDPHIFRFLNVSKFPLENYENPIIQDLIKVNNHLSYNKDLESDFVDYLDDKTIKTIAENEKYQGDEYLQYVRDNIQIISRAIYIRIVLDDLSYFRRQNKKNLFWDFFTKIVCATRKIKLTYTNEFNISINRMAILACSIKDYDLPGKNSSTINKYPKGLVRYIRSKLRKIPQSEIYSYDILADLFEIERGILDLNMIGEIITRGYINPLPLSDKELTRYDQWKILDVEQKKIMSSLYGKETITIKEYIKMENIYFTCEDMVINYDSEKLEAQMLSYGMLKPDNIPALDYFISSLPLYNNPNFAGNPFEWKTIDDVILMSDIEIVEYILEGHIGHISREDLLDKAMKYMFNGEMFFLLKEQNFKEREELFKYISERPSKNPLNLLFRYDISSIEQIPITISELDVLNRDVISPGEIGDSFKVPKINVYLGKINKNGAPITKSLSDEDTELFKRVICHAKVYYDSLVSDLKEISPEDRELIESTNKSLNYLLERIDYVALVNKTNYYIEKEKADIYLTLPDIYCSFILEDKKFTMSPKQLIIKGLLTAFDCGMLQRQWKGSRDDYPYTKEQSGTEEKYENTKDLIVGNQLHLLNKIFIILKQLSPIASLLLENLTVVTMKEEDFQYEMFRDIYTGEELTKTLKMLYDDISKGEVNGGLCIRLGSAKFIWTSYYWLKLFGDVSVLGNFDVTKTMFFG